MRPEFYQGYVVLLLVTILGKFQIFVTIFAHSTTPINEVCLEPLRPSYVHGRGLRQAGSVSSARLVSGPGRD